MYTYGSNPERIGVIVNFLAQKYYQPFGESDIQEVIVLSDQTHLDWLEISQKVPDLPRSWFELSRISVEERIEFISDLWLDRLPFHPLFHFHLSRFFSTLDDIAILVVKKDFAYFVEMVYSLSNNSSFFRGFPPATEEDVRVFKNEIGQSLPPDYLSFLRLHNGFGKLGEVGILSIEDVARACEDVQHIVTNPDRLILCKGQGIDPTSLIPFYEDYGLNSFQCFFSDWYPGVGMGNVYLSGVNYTLSNIEEQTLWTEQLAFTSFLEWLTIYLEGQSVSG